jgi:hypothetical protein
VATTGERGEILHRWHRAFRAAIRGRSLAPQLQAAADGARLRPWTELLTAAVVQACAALGWECAARNAGHRPLPVGRDEYLGIDVLAFEPGCEWRRPIAAFELENSPRDETVAYALWKVGMIRVGLGCLVCYRRQQEGIGPLIGRLQDTVLRCLRPDGEVLVVVGTRAAADTFPDGYFRTFRWRPESGTLET